MISLKLTIDKRRVKNDGTYPLVFKIRSDRNVRDIATGYSTHEMHWNNRAVSIKETHPSFEIISPRIKELELKYLAKLIEFEKAYPHDKNVQRVKEYLTSVNLRTVTTVYTFWEQEITLMHKASRNGGARVYQLSLNAIHKVRDLNIPFERVDYTFVKGVEADLISNGLNLNSVGVYFRTLRAIYNKAMNSNLVSNEAYPFKAFKIRRHPTTPRVLSLEEIRSYFKLKLDRNSWLYENWLIGKLMFLLIGINLTDVITLTECNLKRNRVSFNRAKTNKPYNIKLLPEAEKILSYFRKKYPNSETVLGKLTKQELENRTELPYVIHQKNKVFNAHLDKIGKMIECKEKLTGYVFRYTWSNIAKQLGYSKDLIAEALGHEYGNQITGIYLEAYDKELIDEMNERILKQVTM